MKYRPDIDGLRAFAVLPVIFFHLGWGFSGGFVGVDIFFVISGYLITGILLRDFEREESFKRILQTFYERRARRILPAFSAVVFTSLVFAALWYFPGDLIKFANSLIASNLFVSNFQFWSEINYFHPNSDTKPLLHTWSLSVEEQFYIFFPIFLFIIYKIRRNALLALIIITATLSFILSLYTSVNHPSVSFFWSPVRAWELLAGALALILPKKEKSSAFSTYIGTLAGLFLILSGFFLIDKHSYFPGWVALFPVIGTALILYYGGISSNNFVTKLLGSPPLVFIGKISYSLYLWHWPIIVFYKYYVIRPLNVIDFLLILVATFSISFVSWRYIEQPFRDRKFLSNRVVFRLSFLIITVSCLLGLAIKWGDGLPSRFSPEVIRIAKYGNSFDGEMHAILNDENSQNQQKGLDLASSSFAIIGDSHAGVLYPKFKEIAQDYGENFSQFTTGGHPPIVEVKSHRPNRDIWFAKKFNEVLNNPQIKIVYIGAQWSAYIYGEISPGGRPIGGPPNLRTPEGTWFEESAQLDYFEEMLKKTIYLLTTSGKQVVLIGDIPEYGYHIPNTLAFIEYKGGKPEEFLIPEEVYTSLNAPINSILSQLAAEEDVYFIDPAPLLKSEAGGYMVYSDSHSLYFDDDHLSLAGAEFISPVLEQSFIQMHRLISNDLNDSSR